MATTFQRARSDEQRALRRQAILETAAAMLDEMPVADLSLNELSRRVGLAKSNVLRYFDSREAVLLELLTGEAEAWLAALAAEIPAAVSARAGFDRRAAQLAEAVAASVQQRPVFCDLMSAQPGVLEHNVSAAAVAEHKVAGLRVAAAIADLVRDALPELDADRAHDYVIGIWLITSALWAYARPPASVVEAYATHPELAGTQIDFAAGVADYLTTIAMGLRARGSR